jgi:hypothetical protein
MNKLCNAVNPRQTRGWGRGVRSSKVNPRWTNLIGMPVSWICTVLQMLNKTGQVGFTDTCTKAEPAVTF